MKKQILGLAAASLIALSAQASELSYNYAEIDYELGTVEIEVAGVASADFDISSVALKGSFAATDNIHVFLNYSGNEASEAGIDLEAPLTEFGVGYNYSVAPATDLIAQLAFASQDAELDGDSGDDSGYSINLGVRSLISPQIELNGFVKYRDIWSIDGGLDGAVTNFSIGGVYNFTENFAVTLEGEFGEALPSGDGLSFDATVFRIGGRYNF